MEADVSPVFYKNYHSVADVVVNQGGTRSGKTYSILMILLLKYCLQRTGLIIDIVRKTQSEIRDTLLPDWEEILENSELNDEVTVKDITKHRATYLQYEINDNKVRFIGLDKAQKKRGAKRHILYVNEANGITKEDWMQLIMRLQEKAFIDFNPSEEFFVHEDIFENPNYVKIDSETYNEDKDNPLVLEPKLNRKKRKITYEFIKSTYLDNYDFLSEHQINFIETLIGQDSYYEQVYVYGNLTEMKGKIYSNHEYINLDFWEDELDFAETFYGLDVGFVHYMALVEIKYYNEAVYERCIFMESGKMDEDLLEFCEQSNISWEDDIYVDSAAPTMIKKLRNKGFTARKAVKDVKEGIRFCQQLPRFIVNDGSKASEIYIKQMNKYKYKQTPDGKVMDGVPVKIDDDGPDAVRYGEYTHLRNRIHTIGIRN